MGAMDKVKDIVRAVAPALGAALGGPVAGAATSVIAGAVLGKADASEADVSDAILNGSPEVLAKVKQAEFDFRAQMEKLNIDVFTLEAQDRDSARQLFKTNIWPQIVLSAVFITGYFGLMGALLFILMDKNAQAALQVLDGGGQWYVGMLMTVVGVLTAAVPQILGFWFGSSNGSKDKTGMMAAAATGAKA